MENKSINSNGKPLLKKLLPLILTVAVIILDQVTKSLVVKFIPRSDIAPFFGQDSENSVIEVFGSFLRLIHVRNPAVAFSMGASLPDNIRMILFSILPLIVIGVVFVIYFRNKDFTQLQRWSICGIVGGGLGNLIDRFFRPEGVVDFIDVYFPIYFKSKRWPTFNIADSAVVVCGILFVVAFIIVGVKNKKKEKKSSDE
ncbi:MAG: signal peptidase II [Treponema sp.]|nr:signal peptidase II [Treponema sp.]